MASSHATRPRWTTVAGAVLSAALGVTVLAGCTQDDRPPTSKVEVDVRPVEDVDDPYNGPYSEAFRDEIEGYTGLEVSLLGEVQRIVSPIAFTLGGEEDVEPILVVMDEERGALVPGQAVAVAAVPQGEFALAEVEAAIGSDLPDDAYADWEGGHYLEASIVEPRD